MLRMLPTYVDSSLVRTRDPAVLATCHTVVDVGGEYNPDANRYDHHQRTFQETFPGHNTRLSSAGLVFLHFGKAIIARQLEQPIESPDVQTIHEKLYSDYIESLDAHDNGISVYDPEELAASGIKKRFRDTSINLGSLVGDMNYPHPNAPPIELQDEDSLFDRASTFIGDTFLRKLFYACHSWLPARVTVTEAYQTRKSVHSSGRLMVMPRGGVPWKEHLYGLEEAAAATGEGVTDDSPPIQVYYVLYPESTKPNAKWRVQCVPEHESSFVSRKPLPEAWRGVRDQDLDGMLVADGIPPGAVFVHASGFIGGHATREGAFAMAVKSLQSS